MSYWLIYGCGSLTRGGWGQMPKLPAIAQTLHRVSLIHLGKQLQTITRNRWTVENYRSPIISKLVLTGIKSKRPIHISSQWPAILLHAIFSRPALFRHRKRSDLLPKHFETVSKPQVEVLTTGKRSIYHRERCKNVFTVWINESDLFWGDIVTTTHHVVTTSLETTGLQSTLSKKL